MERERERERGERSSSRGAQTCSPIDDFEHYVSYSIQAISGVPRFQVSPSQAEVETHAFYWAGTCNGTS